MNYIMPATSDSKKIKENLIKTLREVYADYGSALNFENPYQQLVATILAAQCTDKRVNEVTPALFAKYPDAAHLAGADLGELTDMIKTCGLYRNKAKNLKACAIKLIEEFGGQVPNTMEELISLPGVGRKTANCVLAFSYGIPAFPVDTHVKRVANRLGLSRSTNPDLVEEDVKRFFDKADWASAHRWLIWHGREVCTAKKPNCSACAVKQYCPTVK